MSTHRRIRAGVAVLAVAYFALWACAPVASNPPPAPMVDGRAHELGGTASVRVVSPATRFVEVDCATQAYQLGCSGPAVAAWWRYGAGRWDLTTQVGGGVPEAVSGDLRLAFRALDHRRVFVAPALHGGWLSAGAAVYTGVAVSDSTWVVATPILQLSNQAMARGSLGMWHTGPKGAVFGAELGGALGPQTPWAVDASISVGAGL